MMLAKGHKNYGPDKITCQGTPYCQVFELYLVYFDLTMITKKNIVMLKDWMTQPSSKLFATKCIWIQLLHFQNHDFF